MRMDELATGARVNPKTIRSYEERGLLPDPDRAPTTVPRSGRRRRPRRSAHLPAGGPGGLRPRRRASGRTPSVSASSPPFDAEIRLPLPNNLVRPDNDPRPRLSRRPRSLIGSGRIGPPLRPRDQSRNGEPPGGPPILAG